MKHYRIKHTDSKFEVYERGFLRYHFLESFSTEEEAHKFIQDENHGISVIVREIE